MTSVKRKRDFFCGLLLFIDLRCDYRKDQTGTTLQNSHNIGITKFCDLDSAHLLKQQLTKSVASFLLRILDSEVDFR